MALLLPLSGCSDGTTGAGTTKMSILLTDAPAAVKQAVVTISQIYLQGSSGRVVLMDTSVTTDLLTLSNATAQLVKDAVIPSGTYAQLRFVVTGGYIQVEDSSGGKSIYASSPNYAGLPAGAQVTGPLQMPSAAQSGIKVTMPNGAVSIMGNQQVLLVDFDVSQSFGHAAGSSGTWVMHPVIKATDFQATGSVTETLAKDSSVVLPSLNGSPVTLADFAAVLTSTDSSTKSIAFVANGDGTYAAQFRFLQPGTYTVDIAAPPGLTFTTSPTHPATVMVRSGANVSRTFALTSVATTP
jgi:hypothetical protein